MTVPIREDSLDHFDLIVGFTGNGGILSSIESGVVTGVLSTIFSLGAGDIAPQTITALSSPRVRSLIACFNPAAPGALLEV